jgi:hypothetical protein
MQSEDFDKKVKDAAEQHHPPYDEHAWVRMEKLLNKHIPVEEDNRRRILFLVLLFVGLGGGAWLFFNRPVKQNVTAATENVKSNSTSPVMESSPGIGGQETLSGPVTPITPGNTADDAIEPVERINAKSSGLMQRKSPVPNHQHVSEGLTNLTVTNDNFLTGVQPSPGINIAADNNKITGNKTDMITKDVVGNDPSIPQSKVVTPSVDNKDIVKAPVVKTEEKKNIPENNKTDQAKKKTESSKKSFFFFSLSAGPDLSSAGTHNPGKAKLLAGAGFGYSFKDKFTLRTGFYSSRKVYSALPSEYNPPDNSFWTYYPFMEKIDADCKVYEIPISLSYQFGHSDKDHWFASTGISSYLMKKETYKYYYKYTQTGPTVNRSWTLKNENNHYFSVVTLSGGYQRNLGKTFSLTAEPYVKIPLGGVGFGKVKLNSAGMLVTVGIKAFGTGSEKKKRR